MNKIRLVLVLNYEQYDSVIESLNNCYANGSPSLNDDDVKDLQRQISHLMKR